MSETSSDWAATVAVNRIEELEAEAKARNAHVDWLEEELDAALDDVDDMVCEVMRVKLTPWLCRAEGMLLGLIVAVIVAAVL